MGVGLNLGDTSPNFIAESTVGSMDWYKYIDGSWALLCSHPGDFTPVCTTELGVLAKLQKEFDSRGVKLAALSCNNIDSHKAWISDIEHYSKVKVKYPLVADPNRTVATQFGMLDPVERDSGGLPMTCRACFLFGPDKRLRFSVLYPSTTGRNFSEILRAIDSVQVTSKYSVATPVDWVPGNACMVVPTLCDRAAKEQLPGGFKKVDVPSEKNYIRITPDPGKRGKRPSSCFGCFD